MTLSVYPNSLKFNISMSNRLIVRKKCSLNRRIPMLGEYGSYGQIRANKCKYDKIMVNKAKEGVNRAK